MIGAWGCWIFCFSHSSYTLALLFLALVSFFHFHTISHYFTSFFLLLFLNPRPRCPQIGPNTVLVQFDQRHRRSAGFGNVKFRTVADAQRAVAMAAAATEPEGGLVIDGAAVTVVPSQVQ
jgi:hypothetical protein